jgi:hypothetical protein
MCSAGPDRFPKFFRGKLLPLAAMGFFHAVRDGFLELRFVDGQGYGGCLKQIPFGNDRQRNNGGFMLRTNESHISKARCGAPSLVVGLKCLAAQEKL